MDATTIICICHQLSNTEVLAITEKSASNHLGIRCSAGDTCIFQLAADTEAGVGIDWGRNHPQHIVVARRDWPVGLHFRHQIGWRVEWILMARVC